MDTGQTWQFGKSPERWSPTWVMGAVAPENACVTIDDGLIESDLNVRVEVTRWPSAPQSRSVGRCSSEVCIAVREYGGLGGGCRSGGVLALNKNPGYRSVLRNTSFPLQSTHRPWEVVSRLG